MFVRGTTVIDFRAGCLDTSLGWCVVLARRSARVPQHSWRHTLDTSRQSRARSKRAGTAKAVAWPQTLALAAIALFGRARGVAKAGAAATPSLPPALATSSLPPASKPAPGLLYIADTANHVIRRVRLAARRVTGTIETIAGSNVAGNSADGVAPLRARFRFPWGVALGGSPDEVCVARVCRGGQVRRTADAHVVPIGPVVVLVIFLVLVLVLHAPPPFTRARRAGAHLSPRLSPALALYSSRGAASMAASLSRARAGARSPFQQMLGFVQGAPGQGSVRVWCAGRCPRLSVVAGACFRV